MPDLEKSHCFFYNLNVVKRVILLMQYQPYLAEEQEMSMKLNIKALSLLVSLKNIFQMFYSINLYELM